MSEMKDAIRVLLQIVLQDAVPENVTVTVRLMRLGKEMFEKRLWYQSTLDDFYDMQIGTPLVSAKQTIAYTINPRYLNGEEMDELYIALLEDLKKTVK